MKDIISVIRDATASSKYISRINGGYVPLPVPQQNGRNIFVVNCEYVNELERESANRILDIARHDATMILGQLSHIKLDDTTGVCIRFGFYVGHQLRDTVYACNVPADHLIDLPNGEVGAYWLRSFNMNCPIEYSTIPGVTELLSSQSN